LIYRMGMKKLSKYSGEIKDSERSFIISSLEQLIAGESIFLANPSTRLKGLHQISSYNLLLKTFRSQLGCKSLFSKQASIHDMFK
jgi:hypothetical protein